jgi:CubicO group peptidase (beta-lactamase class C family)
MSETTPIDGYAAAPFEPVADAFRSNFNEGLELGAHFAVFIDGEPVVNLWGGHADRQQQTPWTEDRLPCIYSSGKAAVALLVARAVSEGLLDYDAQVATWWPEFAQAGKQAITLADALSHQAGLVGIADEMPPEEWLEPEKISARIAAMAPLFPPRSASGYSPQLVGFLARELLARVAGRPVGQMLREDFAEAHGLDIHCGLQPDEMARTVYMPKPPRAPDLGVITELKSVAFLKPWSAPARVSREAWMAAELPASNMHCNATALAEIVHPFANGGHFRGAQILSSAAIEGALRERTNGDDLVLPFHLSWCAGLMRNINGHFGPSEAALGHAGFGGSCVVVDPASRLSAAYVMSKMSPHLVGDPRAVRLLDAVYDAL